MRIRRQSVVASLLLFAIAVAFAWLACRPTPEGDRRLQAESRLRSLLRHPDSLVIHSLRESPWDKGSRSVEVRFSAQGADGQSHTSIYFLIFFPDGTTAEEFEANPEHPDQYPYDPHSLIR